MKETTINAFDPGDRLDSAITPGSHPELLPEPEPEPDLEPPVLEFDSVSLGELDREEDMATILSEADFSVAIPEVEPNANIDGQLEDSNYVRVETQEDHYPAADLDHEAHEDELKYPDSELEEIETANELFAKYVEVEG
jgi:hypothetical protein